MKTTTVVTFGEPTTGEAPAVLELDDTMHREGLVTPGEPVYFLLHHDPAWAVGRMAASAGHIEDLGEVLRDRTERVEVVTVDEPVGLRYMPAGQVTWTWYGARPLSVSVSGRQAAIDGDPPLIGDAACQVRFRRYRLDPPAGIDGEFPVLLVAYMEEEVEK